MIPIFADDADEEIVIQVSDFGDLTGVIESKPELVPECWNDQAVDVAKAWQAVEDVCRGHR